MDAAVYCRLRNDFLGHSPGQLWRIVARRGGKYALRTAYLGDCFSLDVINDGTNTIPCLAVTGDFTGQM
jgi:hypothetical protein